MKYFLFGMFVWFALFPKTLSAQGLVLKVPEPAASVTKLPLEWRGMWLSFDAQNRFQDKFSQMRYGFGASAMIGYKNYNFRAEAIMPISNDAWLYRVKFEYQVF